MLLVRMDNCGFVVNSLFLANLNSRSSTLFAVARPSLVCLSSVTFVCRTQAVQMFGNICTALGTSATR